MEVFLYNSTVCRLCGEENDNGTLLYSTEENSPNLCEIINTYLPIKVTDDGQLPRTICPGCTIQLEATVEFMTLIINGQKVLRELHQREKEYKKSLLNSNDDDIEIVYEVNTEGGVYQLDQPIALKVAGLSKPKRKRGRPPKKPKTPEELAQEAAAREQELKASATEEKIDESGKRRRKTPNWYREAVQGKELEKILKEEGVTDGEDSDHDTKQDAGAVVKSQTPREPEVIGHMENSGEPVVIVKGKGRGRPRGPMRQVKKQCAICGAEFSCSGRYMAHVAAHGPVQYACARCGRACRTLLQLADHHARSDHAGHRVLPVPSVPPADNQEKDDETTEDQSQSQDPEVPADKVIDVVSVATAPETSTPATIKIEKQEIKSEFTASDPLAVDNPPEVASGSADSDVYVVDDSSEAVAEKSSEDKSTIASPSGKPRLNCPHCDKTFASKQSKSMHIKASHRGETPYVCAECGARFAYPRSLAVHRLSHRRHARASGYACDLCGKVLNHPSSVVYHKEAEHAGHRYVCGKCGKLFKHKQLLQRHQMVHTQARPHTCKICNSTFKTKANLINHQLLHSGIKKFSCDICKQKFAHKTSLTLHMRWHTGQKPYSCNICGKSFSQKGNLSEHERIHTGEKPFQCALCSRKFTTSSQHRLHLQRHAAEKPYACNHCPKRFVSRGAWSAHARRVSGAVGAHACSVCSRAFSSRYALLKHSRVHSGERPHRCPHCPRAFADCSNLNKHKKQVHKQVSLLATQPGEEVPQEATEGASSERVIYVTYDVRDPDASAFHILAPEQAATIDPSKVLTTCELFPGPSLLMRPEEVVEEQLVVQEEPAMEEQEEVQETEAELEPDQQIPVTDEQGNPLHFTMPDGTRLVITSSDGKSLQVITHDGQTIPVEINGYGDEEEVEESETVVQHVNIQKTDESSAASPVTHYFTIV